MTLAQTNKNTFTFLLLSNSEKIFKPQNQLYTDSKATIVHVLQIFQLPNYSLMI